jgi:hypothetical protein
MIGPVQVCIAPHAPCAAGDSDEAATVAQSHYGFYVSLHLRRWGNTSALNTPRWIPYAAPQCSTAVLRTLALASELLNGLPYLPDAAWMS